MMMAQAEEGNAEEKVYPPSRMFRVSECVAMGVFGARLASGRKRIKLTGQVRYGVA
ncbi:MAG: hypothetical protein LKE96_10855 [Acetobacter peroxydans]|jgi:hypothetical protein|nr:hypothetical protein [Acetobacter peroxydans]MCI2079105.1 hypothetical protein [Acetobacter peroxydans]